MNVLARVFGVGRLGKPPKRHTAGRLLPPASVQRSQLGLSHVDLPAGVVTVRGGEVRCLLKLSGFPLHARSGAEARAFLGRFAQALNALPPSAAWLVRARPADPAPEPRRPPGTPGTPGTALVAGTPAAALARLAADQLAHYRRQAVAGATRQTSSYVAFRHRKGDVGRLLRDAATAATHLRAAGLTAELVTDRALAAALADSWRPPATEHLAVRLPYPGGDAAITFDEGVTPPARVRP